MGKSAALCLSAFFFAAFSHAVEFETVFEMAYVNVPKFTYAGKPFNPQEWKKTEVLVSDSADIKVTRAAYVSHDGLLRVSQTVKRYKKFPIVEWETELEGIGESKTAVVEDFFPFYLELKNKWQQIHLDGVKIRRWLGSDMAYTDFLPSDFYLERRPFSQKMSMESFYGYSSSEWMPYIGLDFNDDNGLNVAIGWSGNWRADFELSEFKFFAKIGMLKTKFYLNSGEKIRQPSMAVMARKRMGVSEASNVWRKFMFAHKTPRGEDGGFLKTPVIASRGGNTNEGKLFNNLKNIVENKVGAEAFGVDAGWFGGPHIPKTKTEFGDWALTCGDWRVNTTILPNGFAGFSDAVHAAGMKFSLWLELERVNEGTPLSLEHPEYIAKGAEGKMCLLNLGNPAAWEYMFNAVSKIISDYKVDIWRMDSDRRLGVAEAWKKLDGKEGENRIGISEAKHIDGLYRFWEEMLKKHKGLVIDNCASGGRRLDFEAMSRSIVVWRSDAQCVSRKELGEINQVQNFYLHEWLPMHITASASKDPLDEYMLMSAASTGIVVGAGSFHDNAEFAFFKKSIERIKRMREIMMSADFYRLTSQPENSENWCAYQFHNSAKNEGFAIVFRREKSPSEKIMVHCRAIDERAEYSVENKNGEVFKKTGTELKDIAVSLPPRNWNIFFYRKNK